MRGSRSVSIGLQLFICAGAVAVVAWSALHADGLGTLRFFYLAAAVAGELLIGEGRGAQPFQFGVGLALFATVAGHGDVAPLIAVAVLGARRLQAGSEAWPWSPTALVLPLAAGAMKPAADLVVARLPAMPMALSLLPATVSAALAFLVVNAALVSACHACDNGDLAMLRLRQHLPALVRRYLLAAMVVWAAEAVCERFFTADGTVLILSSYAFLAFYLRSTRRRHLHTQAGLLALVKAIGHKDAYTAGHVERVGILARALAGEFGLPQHVVERVGFAAAVHDLGKVTVSGELLRSTVPLDAAGRTALEAHTTSGEELLRALASVPEAALVAGGHHERWDGAGYPRGLAGQRIPVAARITALADAWDAMTSDRPYRRALPEHVAREEVLRGRGTQFDPAVVDAFTRLRLRALPGTSLLSLYDTAPVVE